MTEQIIVTINFEDVDDAIIGHFLDDLVNDVEKAVKRKMHQDGFDGTVDVEVAQ